VIEADHVLRIDVVLRTGGNPIRHPYSPIAAQ
jgi:hypothetical protein